MIYYIVLFSGLFYVTVSREQRSTVCHWANLMKLLDLRFYAIQLISHTGSNLQFKTPMSSLQVAYSPVIAWRVFSYCACLHRGIYFSFQTTFIVIPCKGKYIVKPFSFYCGFLNLSPEWDLCVESLCSTHQFLPRHACSRPNTTVKSFQFQRE